MKQDNTRTLHIPTGKLQGKVAIVTGAGSGIGAATAALFAAEGAKVMLTNIHESKVKDITGTIIESGGIAAWQEHDVSDEAHWGKVVNATLSIFGRIDILVNNAGITGDLSLPFGEQSIEEFNKVLSVNLTGQFIGMKVVHGYMNPGGSIVNVSSIAGITGNAGGNAYTASKGGLRMLSKGAAINLAPKGIRVNSLHPGFVETPMTHDMQGADNFRQMALQSTPLGRGASAQEIARGILFLASDDSSFMTGSELIMDGGFTAF